MFDNGSGVLKGGFAGEDRPKCVFNSFVGRPKHVRVMAGVAEGDFFVGDKAEALKVRAVVRAWLFLTRGGAFFGRGC